MYFVIKTLISALIIATVTKLSEKAPVGGALLKSLPLTSLMVFFIMKFEGRTNQEMASMSWDILWLVIPSLLLFMVLPFLLERGFGFYSAMGTSVLVMCLGYVVTLKLIA